MWYFAENGDRKGPVTPEEVKAFIGSGKIGPATLVWREGLEDWVPIVETELRDLLPADLPPTTQMKLDTPSTAWTETTAPTSATEIEAKIQQLETWFKLHWICLAAGAVLLILIIGIFGLLAAAVFAFMLLYQFWKVIQAGPARTTPLKAVLFLFIPFFNLYWQFVAFWGLAQDTNTYLRQHHITAPHLDENLPLLYCILNLCSIIPSLLNLANAAPLALTSSLGFLLSIASLVLWILNLRAFKNAAIAILRARAAAA